MKTRVMSVVTILSLVIAVAAISLSVLSAAQGPSVSTGSIPSVLNYQGRLADSTGDPVPDGDYGVTFRIYDTSTGGTALWSETYNMGTTGGLFNVLLGSVTPLSKDIFAGTTYLGVQVGSDAEMTPRQLFASVPYAFQSQNANTLDGMASTEFSLVGHDHDATYLNEGQANSITSAMIVDGAVITADLALGSVTGVIIADGSITTADIAVGSVSSALIADGAVAAEDVGFNYAGSATKGGTASDADLLDGLNSTQFMRSDANTSTSGSLTVGGTVTTTGVTYSAPRTHYFSVGGEGFVPTSNVDYFNSNLFTSPGNGGAYVVSGWEPLVAPVHLPQGAVVTEFKVFYYDNSATGELLVRLRRLVMGAGGYQEVAAVSTTGTPGYASLIDSTISYATIDNTAYSYSVSATAANAPWDGTDRKIMGAVITYTIAEAE